MNAPNQPVPPEHPRATKRRHPRHLGQWRARRRYEEKRLDGKKWIAVERLAEDNKAGWVYDPYLKCEEDGGH
jgi:hypothetical protein